MERSMERSIDRTIEMKSCRITEIEPLQKLNRKFGDLQGNILFTEESECDFDFDQEEITDRSEVPQFY